MSLSTHITNSRINYHTLSLINICEMHWSVTPQKYMHYSRQIVVLCPCITELLSISVNHFCIGCCVYNSIYFTYINQRTSLNSEAELQYLLYGLVIACTYLH